MSNQQSDPHIEVMCKATVALSGKADIVHQWDLDKGPLAMPEHIKIGGLTWDNVPIMSYSVMLDEYEIWLEDQIKARNIQVMCELDEIYTKAVRAGVILVTTECPSPFRTHAHVVAKTIMELASELGD